MPVQTLSTIGATAAAFLSVGGQDLLVVSNAGGSGNREINSTVYQFNDNGQLEVVRLSDTSVYPIPNRSNLILGSPLVYGYKKYTGGRVRSRNLHIVIFGVCMIQARSIATVGASDIVTLEAPNGEWYVVIASREDNEGSPNVDSVVLRWNEGSFVLFQSLETIGASAVSAFSIGEFLYLTFASFTDTRYILMIYGIVCTYYIYIHACFVCSDLQYMYGEMDSFGWIIM